MAVRRPLFSIVEGWTGEVGPFTLQIDGAAVSLTGMTVVLRVRASPLDTFVDTVGDVRVDSDQVGTGKGKVYFKPDAADFDAELSPYFAHWQVTDGAGDVVFFPNVGAELIVVYDA